MAFPVLCYGRDAGCNPVLTEPVHALVVVSQRHGDETTIKIDVDCPHNKGGHGEHCTASGSPDIHCPYAVDLPSAFDGHPVGGNVGIGKTRPN